jgi:molecular chaperone GrpE
MSQNDEPSASTETLPPETASTAKQEEIPEQAPAADLKQLQAELAAARAEAAENQDKFLRAKAETDNVRRRAEQDIAAARKYAVERFAAEILPVRDSLDLARNLDLQLDSASAVQKMHEGLDLTLRLMDGVFQKFGLSLIDPKGEKFDPNRHQAISMVESTAVPANHVLEVVQKGFVLQDRVLRPAMVVVAKAPAPAAGTEAPPAENP